MGGRACIWQTQQRVCHTSAHPPLGVSGALDRFKSQLPGVWRGVRAYLL
jgi:hypothetical protein